MAAAAATGEASEASQAAPSPFERLRLGFKAFHPQPALDVAAEGGAGEPAKPGGGSWGAWVDRTRKAAVESARKVAYDAVPQAQAAEPAEEQRDVEAGEAQPHWAAWAKAAASRAKKQVASATKGARRGVAHAAEKATSADWSEQAKGLQSGVTQSFGKVADGASQATAALSEKGKKAQQMAKDLQSKSQKKLSEAKAVGAAQAQAAKEKATAAAGSVKAAAAASAGKVTQGLSGLSALAMSPAKLAQFAAVFFVGVMLISFSFSFLPLLPISPQKFALLFAFGSMTLLSSFAILKGPEAFAKSLMQREKLPFSAAYVLGLVGTLVATIAMRSFLLTAIFGLLQAVALLYFLASYVPGGQALLGFCGRLGGRAARTVCRQAT